MSFYIEEDLLKDQKFSIVIASDCHFSSSDEKKAKQFLQSIQDFDWSETEYFILLGDIFDFCFGASNYFREKFSPFYESFKYISSLGVKVIFLQGNHEFSFDKINWPEVEIVTKIDRVVSLKDGTKFALTHGDRLLAPPSYFWYLKITRSKVFAFVSKFLPQAWLDRFALSISRKSRSKDKYRVLDHERVINAVKLWLEKYPDAHGLFGHFHYPYYESVSNSHRKIVSTDSWHNPNFLAYKDGKFFRIFPKEGNIEFQRLS